MRVRDRVLLWSSGVGVLVFVGLLASYWRHSTASEREKLAEVQALTQSAAAQVAERVGAARLVAQFVARGLSGAVPPAGLDVSRVEACNANTSAGRAWAEACLAALLRDNADLFGASITYRPSPGPSSVYIYKNELGELVRGEIPSKYATTTEASYAWYREPMRTGTEGWSPPYYDDAGQALMTTYSALFYPAGVAPGTEQPPLGVVTIDVSGERLRQILQHLDLGPSGYGALTAADGTYLYHPDPEYTQGQKSLLRIAEGKGDLDRKQMWQAIQRGESGTMEHRSTTTGEDSWLIYVPVGDSGWSLQNTFLKQDIPFDVDRLRRRLVEATATAIGVLLLLLAFVVSRREYPVRREWIFSTGSALLFIIAIAATWILALHFPPSDRANAMAAPTERAPGCDGLPPLLGEGGDTSLRVTELSVLKRIEQRYRQRAACQMSLEPVFVQVGTQIDVFRFQGPNEIQVAGLLWTRVPATAPAEVRGEVSLIGAASESFREFDARTLPSGDRVARWRFEATLVQSRSSNRYPIEREAIHIEFAPPRSVLAASGSRATAAAQAGRGYRVYLVPALEDYEVTTPSARPGLLSSLVVAGWRAKASYFELSPPRHGAGSGLGLSVAELNPPSLAFTVVMERDFADAFISNLTPIIVVALMLFAVLLVSARLDYGRALSICMAMFFVIVFSHIDLRQRLAVQEVFYLEYFYFTLYAGILWVSFNCLLQGFKTKIALIETRDRLFVTTAYWPALLGTLYVFTFQAFY